jgi:predicted nucleic acid binding AN1-type Zn finger protein
MIVDNYEENKECKRNEMLKIQKKPKKKTRCTFCNKKTGLISFTCDCGGVLCSTHLNAHSHNCYLLMKKKDERQKQLTENNPRIDFKKVEVI